MTGRIEDQVLQIAAEGYDGVEASHKPDVIAPGNFRKLLDQNHLQLIMGTTIVTPDDLESKLTALVDYQPLRIDVHSGRDSMNHDEGSTFFEKALQVEQKIGIPVAHETHRGRFFYTPWETQFYLETFPDLKIVADFSHWVNICERLPLDQQAAMRLACDRAIHIHEPVGYEQGPQVPDPSAPEYANHLTWHETQ